MPRNSIAYHQTDRPFPGSEKHLKEKNKKYLEEFFENDENFIKLKEVPLESSKGKFQYYGRLPLTEEHLKEKNKKDFEGIYQAEELSKSEERAWNCQQGVSSTATVGCQTDGDVECAVGGRDNGSGGEVEDEDWEFVDAE